MRFLLVHDELRFRMNICAGGLSASSGKEEGLSIEVPLFVYCAQKGGYKIVSNVVVLRTASDSLGRNAYATIQKRKKKKGMKAVSTSLIVRR